MAAPSRTCVVLLLCLGALLSDGARLADLGIFKAKSCEKEQAKGHDVSEYEHKKVSKGSVESGKTRLWVGRYLMSDLREDDNEDDSRKSAYNLNESLRQKWQARVRQEKRERQRHDAQTEKPPDLTQTSQPPPRRSASKNDNVEAHDDISRNRDPIPQGLDTNKDNEEYRSFRNGARPDHVARTEPLTRTSGTVHEQSPQLRQRHTRRAHLKSIVTSTVPPNQKSRDRDWTDKMSDVPTRKRKSPITFVTQSSAIYPFIATAQALNFLTSYDSMPRPTRWPIKLILPERDQDANQEGKSMSNNNEKKTVQLSQSNSPHSGCDNKSRRSLKPISKDKENPQTESSILSNVDDSQENTPTTYSNDRSCTEDSKVDDPYIQQQTPTQHTTDTQRAHLNSDEAVEKNVDTRKSGGNNKRKRKRQNGLRRQRKRRKQNMREMGISEVAVTTPAQRDQAPASGSDLVNPQAASDPHSVAGNGDPRSLVTLVEHDRAASGSAHFSEKQDADDGSSHNKRGDGLSSPGNQPSIMYGDTTKRIKYNMSGSSTTSRQQLKTSAYNATSKTQKSSSNDKFRDTFHSRKANDNHMSTSLQQDYSSTQSLAPFGKYKLSSCKEKDLLQNCLQDITNDSPDNTKQHLSLHLPGRTDADLQRIRVRTGSGARTAVPQVTHSNSVQEKVDTNKNTANMSPMLQTKASGRNLMKHTTNVHDGTTNSPKPSSTHKDTTPLHKLPPSIRLSERSSARQWRDRLKQKQIDSLKAPREHRSTPNVNSDSSEPKAVKRKGSLASALSTPEHPSNPAQTPSSETSNVDIDKKESGPFIGYKSAYDFLSNQKGARTPFQNEARREANELNRFMSEGMCQIFGKRYVPTRIGGKCE